MKRAIRDRWIVRFLRRSVDRWLGDFELLPDSRNATFRKLQKLAEIDDGPAPADPRPLSNRRALGRKL
jgi:hypothetical protein